jgi:predicted nucleic acid-binding protein
VTINSNTKIISVDVDNREKIIQIFKKQTSKRVSMTDCVNMAIAKKMGIKRFLSFDEHYKKNGFELIK